MAGRLMLSCPLLHVDSPPRPSSSLSHLLLLFFLCPIIIVVLNVAWQTSTWCGMWSVVDMVCDVWSTWRRVDGVWCGRECPHPSTRGEGQGVGSGDLRLSGGGNAKRLNRYTGDYSYNKSHVFKLAITLLIPHQKLYFCSC